MDTGKDIYSLLLQAQKTKENFKKSVKDLSDLISDFFDLAVQGKITDNLFRTSKQKTVSCLYSRSIVLKSRMQALETFDPDKLNEYLKNEEEYCKLGQYYRDGYYSLFYLCRAITVYKKNFDTTSHSEMPKILVSFKESSDRILEKLENSQAKLETPNKELQEKIDSESNENYILNQMSSLYDVAKEYREISDYSMVEANRIKLANKKTFESVEEKLGECLDFWETLK